MKPLNDFYASRTARNGHGSSCKECEKFYNRNRLRKKKEENNQIIAF